MDKIKKLCNQAITILQRSKQKGLNPNKLLQWKCEHTLQIQGDLQEWWSS